MNGWRHWVPARSWFLFNVWFALLVICVCTGTALHVPIARAAWPILSFCSGLVFILAIKSCRAARGVGFRWRLILTSGLIVGTVVIVLWGCLFKGEFVSVYPDAWSYTAFATYIRNPALAVGDLQPIATFGSHLMKARYGTAGLLALFAEVSGTDPCRSASVLACLVLVQTGLGFALLARIFGAGRILSICAGVFAVSIGWAPEIFKIGNWDQVLFLSFIPFILVRIRISSFQTSRTSGVLGLGLCLGAAAFAYPEGVAISGMIYLPLVVWRLLRGVDLPGKLRRLAVAVGVALLVSSVYLPRFVIFLRKQIASGTHVLNAEGALPGLLSVRWLPATYGLGEGQPITGWSETEVVVPLVFVGLSFLALTIWWRKKDGILFTLPIFFLLTFWQVVLLRYDYGFYKILTMFWPVMVVAIFVGMSRLLAWSRPGLSRPLAIAGFCGIIAGALFDQGANFQYAPWREEREIGPFLELTRLKRISGNAPVCLVTQSWFNQMWAVFFLQGYEIVVPHPLEYLRHRSSGLHDLTTEPQKEVAVLSDEKLGGAIWHNEIFSLRRHLEPVELLGIDAPNSVERIKDDSFIWLNNQFAVLTIHSDANREVLLQIRECWPGPSRPEDPKRTLMVEVNGKNTQISPASNLSIPLALNQGINLVRLSCKETPTVKRLSSGDTRTLLLGIKGLRLATREEPVELLGIDAPNQVETVQGDSFIWLNNQFTDLRIRSDIDRQAVLIVHESWPGPSRPEDRNRTLIVENNGNKLEVPASPNLKVPLKLNQGDNLVRLSCKETPTVAKLSSGDLRTLLLGIKGFSVIAED